jgi:hypothetical protein
MRSVAKSREALRTVGFEVEHEEDLAERPDEVKWYYPLEGDVWKAQTAWDMITVWGTSWSGMLITHSCHVGHGACRSAAQGNVTGRKFPQVGKDWTCQGWSIEVVHSHVSRYQQETVELGVRRSCRLLSVVWSLLHLVPLEN